MSLFRISVYDKNRTFRCQIGNPAALTVTPRHNLTGTASMTVPLNHERVGELMADGARLKIAYRGQHLISGPITMDELTTDGVSGSYTVTVEDDFRVLKDILGWPVPDQPLSGQGAAEHKTYTGDAETIVKAVVADNGVTRLGIPGLTVAANQHRGSTLAAGVQFRMNPLSDLFPVVEDAGIGVSVRQVGASLVLDVYTPTTHPRSLSIEGGTLRDLKMNRSRPAASRAVIGGPGDGANRIFRGVTDTAREAQYGMRSEVFTDAGNATDDTAAGLTGAQVMDAKGNDALAAAGPKNGVAITLSGAGIFQYGPGGFVVGDRIPIKITNDITITEVLRECTLKWEAADYASITPTIGDFTNQPERVTAQRLAALARANRNQERR